MKDLKLRSQLLVYGMSGRVRKLRNAFARSLPKWLVTDVLIRSASAIRNDEVVTDVEFMKVYERWYKRDGV